MIVTRSIEQDFPGEGIDTIALHQAASSITGFLAINRLGDEVQFLFDEAPDEAQLATLDGIVQAHDHPAVDVAAMLALISS